MEWVRGNFYLFSLTLLLVAGGLAYGLYKAKNLLAAKAYAFTLISFSVLVLEQFLLATGVLPDNPWWTVSVRLLLVVAGPFQVLWGGVLVTLLGLPLYSHLLKKIYHGWAVLLLGVGFGGLIFPTILDWGLIYRSFLILAFLSWIVLGILGARNQAGRLKKVLISWWWILPLAAYLLIDVFTDLLPWFLDQLSLALLSSSLSVAGLVWVGALFNRDPYIVDGKITSSFMTTFNLTVREMEIVEKLLLGLSSAQMGEALFISTRTVESHLANIYRKCEVKSRFQLMHLILGAEGSNLAVQGKTSGQKP